MPAAGASCAARPRRRPGPKTWKLRRYDFTIQLYLDAHAATRPTGAGLRCSRPQTAKRATRRSLGRRRRGRRASKLTVRSVIWLAGRTSGRIA